MSKNVVTIEELKALLEDFETFVISSMVYQHRLYLQKWSALRSFLNFISFGLLCKVNEFSEKSKIISKISNTQEFEDFEQFLSIVSSVLELCEKLKPVEDSPTLVEVVPKYSTTPEIIRIDPRISPKIVDELFEVSSFYESYDKNWFHDFLDFVRRPCDQ